MPQSVCTILSSLMRGDDFLKYWYMAEHGELDPFILVVEGSIPNETIKTEGYGRAWGPIPSPGSRSRPTNGLIVCRRPGGRRLRHLFRLWRHPRHGWQSDRLHGLGRLPWLGMEIQGGATHRQCSRLPGPAGQFHGNGPIPLVSSRWPSPDDPARRSVRPKWLFERTVHDGCNRAGYYEQGDFATSYGTPKCIVKLGCWGPVVNCNVPKRGWMAGIGGCPNVGGICIGCTMPGFPINSCPLWTSPPARRSRARP